MEQDATQLGFSGLQAQANILVERGQLEAAMPLLKELILRVEQAEDDTIPLDFPMYLVGTAYVQRFISTGTEDSLKAAIEWYTRLEEKYPESARLKEALLRKVDVYRALRQNDEATALMRKLLAGEYTFHLTRTEEAKLLKDLTQTYYGMGQLAEGLPYFGRLLEVARDPEDRSLAAAASFEALFEAKRLDDAVGLFPALALEADIRYHPRLNVALLRASDLLVDNDRLTDAAIALNLIKTTDVMIQFTEDKLADRRVRLEQRRAFGGAEDVVQRLDGEIKTLETNLSHLRELPTLRNELLVRRARNYTRSQRRFEAFWMFYDLMRENPDSEQSQFYHYATFSNAFAIGKIATVLEIGRVYRERFPDGDYFSDVTAVLAGVLKETHNEEEFLALATDFLTTRPQDAASRTLYAQWASHLLEQESYSEVIAQSARWFNMHDTPVYEDGIFYWGGLAELQLGQFSDAAASFGRLLEVYPTSLYAEDGLLRRGAALYYAQEFQEARETLLSYIERYPRGQSLDQANFFLGEVDMLAGNYERALGYFEAALAVTSLQDIFDSATFRIGTVYETLERYDEMIAHFQAYISRFGEKGRLTDAVYQVGRGFEFNQDPTAMLALYREYIDKYAAAPRESGVDTLIESYAEKYDSNKAMLTRTVEFLDRLERDREFRRRIVTDRGFLFEYFYMDNVLDSTLYNRLRNHPNYNAQLVNDLSPIGNITSVYRKQLATYPPQTPEEFFRSLLTRHQANNNRVGEARMLMGLYRIGVELDPKQPFDVDFLSEATPRLLLYVADYSRKNRLDFAVETWSKVLEAYPTNDAAIVALMRLADVSEQRGDAGAALKHLETIVEKFPGSPQIPSVHLRQGELLSSIGQAQEAREKYQYILRVPEWRGIFHARALYQTGESFMAENKYAEAHGFFERTFLGYSNFPEWAARAYLADAEALIRMGSRQDAIATLEEGITETQNSAPADIVESLRAKLNELKS